MKDAKDLKIAMLQMKLNALLVFAKGMFPATESGEFNFIHSMIDGVVHSAESNFEMQLKMLDKGSRWHLALHRPGYRPEMGRKNSISQRQP